MNMREFQNLSIRESGRQPSGHEQLRPTLPGFDTIAATAGRGQVPTVLRPQNNYSGPQTPLGYQGPPARPPYTHGHFPQGIALGHHGYAHASIEASSPTMIFSTPRDGQNESVYDTCSTSSSSRASSVFTRASISSASTSKPRSSRAKRGSESQGSSDDRKPKRRSRTSHVDNSELWCLDCECLFEKCSSPKVHKAKGKKIVKEQCARGEHAAIIQNHEDIIHGFLNIKGKKLQQPNNRRKSGCNTMKIEVLSSADIAMDEALSTIASYGSEALAEFEERLRRRVEAHDAENWPAALPPGSLMADPSGQDVCPHDVHYQPCQDPIECRKARRGVNLERNLAAIMRSGSARRSVNTPSQRSFKSSKSSTPRRH